MSLSKQKCLEIMTYRACWVLACFSTSLGTANVNKQACKLTLFTKANL